MSPLPLTTAGGAADMPRAAPGRPARLLLQTNGACDFDPAHLLEVFAQQRQRFVTVLQGFGPGDWAAPTRCAGWSAHEVVRHLCDCNARGKAFVSGTAYGVFIAAAVAAMFGDPVQETLTLGGDGGGLFDLHSRDGVTLTVTRVTTAGPPAAQVTDALAGRPPAAAVLGGLPASSRAALSHMADFFNTPAGQTP